MADFLANDFTQPRWIKAAQKNAFKLLGQRRFEFAVAFFYIAGKLADAVAVCTRNLADVHLTALVCRMWDADPARGGWTAAAAAGSSGEPATESTAFDALALGPLLKAADDDDCWLRHLALWTAGQHEAALAALIDAVAVDSVEESDGASRGDGPSVDAAASEESDSFAGFGIPGLVSATGSAVVAVPDPEPEPVSGSKALCALAVRARSAAPDILWHLDALATHPTRGHLVTDAFGTRARLATLLAAVGDHIRSGCPVLAADLMQSLVAAMDAAADAAAASSSDVEALTTQTTNPTEAPAATQWAPPSANALFGFGSGAPVAASPVVVTPTDSTSHSTPAPFMPPAFDMSAFGSGGGGVTKTTPAAPATRSTMFSLMPPGRASGAEQAEAAVSKAEPETARSGSGGGVSFEGLARLKQRLLEMLVPVGG